MTSMRALACQPCKSPLSVTGYSATKGEVDWDTYARGIKLVAEFWDHGDAQLDRELRWSFIKSLDFVGVRGPVAWAYLPEEMQRAWNTAQKYLQDLSALPRKARKRAP